MVTKTHDQSDPEAGYSGGTSSALSGARPVKLHNPQLGKSIVIDIGCRLC